MSTSKPRQDADRAARSAEVWCIFDNTAAGAATLNALDVLARVLIRVVVGVASRGSSRAQLAARRRLDRADRSASHVN